MRQYVGTRKNFSLFVDEIQCMLYQPKMSGEKVPKLAFTNEQSNEIYKNILNNLESKNISKAQAVFVDAVNQIKKLLKEYSPNCKLKDMEKLLDNIRSLQIVLIECRNQSAAFDLFESINATGITLASNDIIKNRLFQIAHENGKDSLKDAEFAWAEIEKNLDYDSSKIKTFIRHQWLSSFGYTSHKRLFKDFEEMIGDGKERNNKALNYLKLLVKDSDIYHSFLTSKVEALKGVTNIGFEKNELRKSLDFLSFLGVDQVYSVLLFFYRNSPRSFKKDLNRLVAFQFLYKYVPGSPSAAEKIFADLTENKTTKDTMFQNLKKLCDGHKNIFIDNLIKKVYYKEGKSGDLQFILEKYLLNEGKGTGFSEPTIEHIIPKSINDNELYEVIHSLGNLTILEKTENGSLQDKPFMLKVDVYKKLWKVNQRIKKYNFEKDPISAIEKRGRDIAGDLYELFLTAVITGKFKFNY